MSEDIYETLSKHLSSLGMGYPPKEELLMILRDNFTPQEAEIALSIPTKVIPFEPISVSMIVPKVIGQPGGISAKDLGGHDTMAKNGGGGLGIHRRNVTHIGWPFTDLLQ
jgi:hypothetical protein